MSENNEALVTDENSHTHQPRKPSSGRGGLLILLVVLAAVAGVEGYGFYHVNEANQNLSRTMVELKQQADDSQRNLQLVQQSLTDLQNKFTESKQQSNQNPAAVTEAYNLAKLANQYLQITHDAQKTYVLLQSANDALQTVSGTAIDAIRQSLANDLTNLQTSSPAATEQIYLQLATIYNQLDNLPLPPAPIQPVVTAASNQVSDPTLPWWKVQWRKSLDALQKVVIVRYTGANDLPLVLPEERMFLYQNLHAQMEAAMMGLLQQNSGVYQVSLARLTAWVKKYFVQDAPLTVNILQQLQELQAVKLQVPTVNLSATLQLFDQFLAQNQSTQLNETQQPPATL